MITPIWFFILFKSIPVLPPIDASTIERRVVGILINCIPLRNVEATKPPRSVTTPPPKLIIRELLSTPYLERLVHSSSHVDKFLFFSPALKDMFTISFSLLNFE